MRSRHVLARHFFSKPSFGLGFWVGVGGVVVGTGVGLIVATKASLIALAIVAVMLVAYFFADFERAVVGLLSLRSCLDIFSGQGLPAAYAIGVDALTLLYVSVLLLNRRTVHTDWFWWFLLGWVMLQGLWVILLPLGGLGLDGEFFPDSIREWTRLFSWVLIYLLVMQLKGGIPPEKMISMMFLPLILPIALALMQVFVPSLIPYSLSHGFESGSNRIKGTLGHSNTFASFLLLFIGLTWWKQGQSRQRWPWLLLLGLLAFLLMSTKALFALMMLAVFLLVLIAPKLSIPNLIGAVLLFGLVILLFGSSDFGQQRLGSLSETPLLNPNLDVSRAILLSHWDGNSFNWRLSQWDLLLNAWRQHPILGYGLGLSLQVGNNGYLPHSDYVRVLVETGVVGMATVVTFFVAQFVRLVQLIRRSPSGSARRELCLIMLAILVAIPVGMITENIWSHTTLFFYWFTLLAVAGWNWNDLQPSPGSVSMKPHLQPLS